MDLKTYEHLGWSDLLAGLCAFAQTEKGRQQCLDLRSDLSVDEIEARWLQVVPLKELMESGYRPPLGEMPNMDTVLKGVSVGQVLDGEGLRDIHLLLEMSSQVQRFANDFSEKCRALIKYRKHLYPLPHLMKKIEMAIGPNGEILDTASKNLQSLRRAKLNARQDIEKKIRQILTDSKVEMYLQDKFYTVRSERYVVPIRLDGRGRVKGSIRDTSESGQTLFIEPQEVGPLNENLAELELSEKLEIARIFRELSREIAEEIDVIQSNDMMLMELDFHTAQAEFAVRLDASPVAIVDSPSMKLIRARHPLLEMTNRGKTVANSISLKDQQQCLVISGPNAGGKTVVLKTIGITHLMVKAGLMPPVDPESEIFLFDDIFVEMGDAQSLTSSLSTFSGHLYGLKPILEGANRRHLVLLDELAVGTEPQTGGAIAQAILEFLVKKGSFCVTTTHFDHLKALPIEDKRFRNGSMEFSSKNLKPTYILNMDVPGQSFGLEVAQDIGLPEWIIQRSKTLRGNQIDSLDQLLTSLQNAQEELNQEKEKLRKSRVELETARAHWSNEKEELIKNRSELSKKFVESYGLELDSLRERYIKTLDKIKKDFSVSRKKNEEVENIRKYFHESIKDAEENMGLMEAKLAELNQNVKEPQLPGIPCDGIDVTIGQQVFVISLNRNGKVIRVFPGQNQFEIQTGLMKIKSDSSDLRILPEEKERKGKKEGGNKNLKAIKERLKFVAQTPTNSLNVRGLTGDKALAKTWDFIDKAVLRGESHLIIIHGHGTEILKKTIRTALAKNSPYSLGFRPGDDSEGGDGVTVVSIDD